MDNLDPQAWCPAVQAPRTSFKSIDEAKTVLNDYAISHGFALVVKRSSKNAVTLVCSQGGDKRSHKAGGNIISPCCASVLSEKNGVEGVIKEYCDAGVEPAAIWSMIRDEHGWATYKDVDNIIARHKVAKLDGLIQIEALHNKLKAEAVISDSLRDENNRLVRLFFAPNESRSLAHKYPEVLPMGCTYATNTHKMPLLHVVGVTGTHNHFTVACCFMNDEKKPSYLWAIARLERALIRPPSIVVVDNEDALIKALEQTWPACQVHLCRWHIEKNIVSNCKKPGMMKDAFSALMKGWRKAARYSLTEEEFNTSWKSVKTNLVTSTDNPEYIWLHEPRDELTVKCLVEAFSYIDKNKVPLLSRFAGFSINDRLHFGHTVTSIAEGAHWSNIKSQSKRSRGNLLDVYDRIQRSTLQRRRAIADKVAKERTEMLSLPKSMFAPVLRGITHYALSQVHKQYCYALHPEKMSVCTRYQRNVMGWPCAHKLREKIESNSQLSMTDFHPHWHKDRISLDPEVHGVLDPYRVEHLRERPTLASQQPQTSANHRRNTRRLPSAFETADAMSAKLPRRCTLCRKPGHDNTRRRLIRF